MFVHVFLSFTAEYDLFMLELLEKYIKKIIVLY